MLSIKWFLWRLDFKVLAAADNAADASRLSEGDARFFPIILEAETNVSANQLFPLVLLGPVGERIGFISYRYFVGIILESVNAVRVVFLLGMLRWQPLGRAFVSMLFFYCIYSTYLMRRWEATTKMTLTSSGWEEAEEHACDRNWLLFLSYDMNPAKFCLPEYDTVKMGWNPHIKRTQIYNAIWFVQFKMCTRLKSKCYVAEWICVPRFYNNSVI